MVTATEIGRCYHVFPNVQEDPSPATNYSLFVHNLDLSANEDDIYNLFTSVGSVRTINLIRNPVSRASLGYCKFLGIFIVSFWGFSL